MIDTLVADLQKYEQGTWHDETQWLDVGLHAGAQFRVVDAASSDRSPALVVV